MAKNEWMGKNISGRYKQTKAKKYIYVFLVLEQNQRQRS